MKILKAAGLALALTLAGGAVALHVMADTSTQPPRTEGEDLYHRGFYDQAIAWWTAQAAKGDAGAAYHLASSGVI